MDAMAVDMDPAAAPANTTTSIGTLEPCARITEDAVLNADEDTTADTLDVDVVVDNVPAATAMVSYAYTMGYEDTALTVKTNLNGVADSFLGVNAGSSLFNGADPVPDLPYVDTLVDLSAAIDDSQTSIVLTGAGGITNGSVIKIQSEVMSVTAGGGTTTLTVVRGFSLSTAAAHPSGVLGSVFIDGGGDDAYNGGGLDTGGGAGEFGDGQLENLTITAAAGIGDPNATAGPLLLPLDLNNSVHIDVAAGAWAPLAEIDGTIALGMACPLPPVDVELVSLSLVSLGSPLVPAGTPFTLRVTATATNNGPNPADIQIDTDITGVPSDCTPLAPPTPQSEAFPAVPPTESRTSIRDWTATCSDPSAHNFSGSGSVLVTGLADDTNLANNGPLTDGETQVITADSDPKVTGVTVTAPGTAATGAPFNVTVEATLHNNGPLDPINVDTNLDLTVPAGCTRTPDNPQPVNNTSLPFSIPTTVSSVWSVTCTTTGLKTFDGNGTMTLNQLHVIDTNLLNNSDSGQATTDTSLAQADVKVTSVAVSGVPASAPIDTNFPVTVNTTVHNNGPFAPVNADITLTLNLPVDCFTPITTLVFQDASLGPSIAAILPEITFFVACIDHSFHNITATATIVIDDPLAGDPTPGNNTLTSAPSTIAILRTADLKVVSATTASPATADTGVPFNVTVDATVHNNGPDPAPGDVSVTLNLPPDCTTSGNPATLPLTLPVSVPTSIPTQTFPVTCTLKSFHDFDANVAIIAPLHVIDSVPANDSALSSSSTTAVFAPSDLKVSSVSISGPPSALVGVAFTVNATGNIHNNGTFGPTNADITVTLSLPPDCTTLDPNPQGVAGASLAVSANMPVNGSWSVTCTTNSFHTFTADALIFLDDLHVQDPNAANDSLGSSILTVPVIAQADGKILSAQALSPPMFIPASTNTNITIRKMLHNNGTFGPANFTLTKSAPAVPGCTITAPAASNHSLDVSVITQVDEVWVINCAPGSYNITFNNTLTVTGLHVADPNHMNNTSSVMITVFVDTDGDGIPDDVENGCGSNPSSGLSIPERVDGVYALVDDDGIPPGSIDEALLAGASEFDCDRDGYKGSAENNVYTPSTQGDQDPCGSNNNPPTVPPSPIGWPADLIGGGFSGNKVNIQDITTYVAPTRLLNTNVGTHPGDIRWDVVPGGFPLPTDINIIDLANITIVKPPMLGNVRAYNGPDCPFPP